MASNSGDSSASALKSCLTGSSVQTNWLFSSQTSVQNRLGRFNCLPYNFSAHTTIENIISNSLSTDACLSIARERVYWAISYQQPLCCLFGSFWLATGVVLRSSPCNGSTCYIIYYEGWYSGMWKVHSVNLSWDTKLSCLRVFTVISRPSRQTLG
jgi:hypothetical protein